MTPREARSLTLLVSFPALVIILVVAPLYWLTGDDQPEWRSLVFLSSMPVGLVTGLFGLLFCRWSSFSLLPRILLNTVNLASISFAIYLAITTIFIMRFWMGLRI